MTLTYKFQNEAIEFSGHQNKIVKKLQNGKTREERYLIRSRISKPIKLFSIIHQNFTTHSIHGDMDHLDHDHHHIHLIITMTLTRK